MTQLHLSKDSGFDRVAWFYDLLAFLIFGRTLQKAQAHFLHCIPHQSTILIMGGGSGWLLKKILRQCTPEKVVYVDASERMLQLSKKKLALQNYESKVDFRLGNETSITGDEVFDVIITPFFLDLFTDARLESSILTSLLNSLSPQGLWIFTDFINSNSKIDQLIIKAMYWFFGKLCHIEAHQLPNYYSLFHKIGLYKVDEYFFDSGLIESSIWKRHFST